MSPPFPCPMGTQRWRYNIIRDHQQSLKGTSSKSRARSTDIKGSLSRDFRLMNQSPRALSIPWGRFDFFSKIRGEYFRGTRSTKSARSPEGDKNARNTEGARKARSSEGTTSTMIARNTQCTKSAKSTSSTRVSRVPGIPRVQKAESPQVSISHEAS